ncbi:hypothetical protein SAMN05216249_103135 [Acetitomaculum ruminis DSM 5522]|uniref:SSD domain-containing protein n=1 Tax=Acetitomaculum ruminis DSM 5522 TaxID=1120918 RepID=A0A1I0W708_9FIRM|nr:MMPL family transporter [Acetitomaculum ruminis]SFA84545.1 hypothetical protein SAMN05216249_103135 [Acetitomaculum ruminis DSM 5522]
MKNGLGKFVVKHRILILVIAALLLIPAAFGYIHTRVNYDILSYLPKDIETMKGQDIMVEEFGKGAFSMCVVEGMNTKDVEELKGEIEKVDHVAKVIWYTNFVDASVPKELLPDELYEAFNNGDCTLMAIMYDDTTSADGTMDALTQIRKIADKKCFISGMTGIVLDTKNLCEKEMIMYVVIAVICSLIVLSLMLDSFLIPFILMISIGLGIIYNMGSNIFLGEISYITKALAAVLQLGVTTDYTIFLWHSYKEEQEKCNDKLEAMEIAIGNTFSSVISSSITTVAGFVALCFMSFTLGVDLGIVMAKGVVLGVISCVTILPALIITFDKQIEKTMHKPLVPDLGFLAKPILKYKPLFIAIFLILLVPAFWGQKNAKVYYNLDQTLPETLDCRIANKKLQDTFNMTETSMILVDADLNAGDMNNMVKEIKNLDGIKNVIGLNLLTGNGVPEALIPEDIISELKTKDYQIMLVSSQYELATDEINKQCDDISAIIKSYDKNAMLVGEAPCTKDLVEITDKDFASVNVASIGAIFVIIALVFKSISLPVLLVSVIEFAIFVNMGIPYYTGLTLPFVASIVIGTIQLGATVDYAILLTTRYKRERYEGKDKKEAVYIAVSTSIQSVITSGLSFFAATFGVGFYSSISMIGVLCSLMARGALISTTTVLLVLPAVLTIFDKVICKTTIGFLPKNAK